MIHPLKLKPYHVLECDNLPLISNKVYDHVINTVDFSKSTRPWTFVDTVSLVKAVPELITWFDSLGLRMRKAAVTYIDAGIPALSSLPVHIDQLPVIAKINLPVYNTDGYLNRWYSISEDYYKSLNLNNKDTPIDRTQCKFLAEIDMKLPIVLNSAIPHEVINTGTGKSPRIVLSCMFFNEPTHYLECT